VSELRQSSDSSVEDELACVIGLICPVISSFEFELRCRYRRGKCAISSGATPGGGGKEIRRGVPSSLCSAADIAFSVHQSSRALFPGSSPEEPRASPPSQIQAGAKPEQKNIGVLG